MELRNVMKEACQAFRAASKVPSLSTARIASLTEDVITVSSTWKQTNLGSYKKNSFARTTCVARATFATIAHSEPVIESAGGIPLSTYRNSVRAIVRSSEKTPDEQFIEIWDSVGLKMSYNLKDIDAHGLVYTDQEFGALDLSADGNSLLYTAELKKPKSLPFLHQGEVPATATQGTQYKYREEWGEQMVGKAEPVMVQLDITSEQTPVNISILSDKPDIPKDVSFGLLRYWEGGVVGVAYRNTPRRLGKVYCSNRPAYIFHLSLTDSKWTEITPSLPSTGMPEVGIEAIDISPSGQLIWFERSLSMDRYPGPHQAALRVMARPSLNNASNTEIYSADQPHYDESQKDRCCGIFKPAVIAKRCWINDDLCLITSTQGQVAVPLVIDIKNKTCKVVTDSSAVGVIVHDVTDGLVLGSRSDPLTPPHLVMANVTPGVTDLKFVAITGPASVPALDKLVWSEFYFPDPPAVEGGESLPFLAHYIGTETGDPKSAPLIVWPHGGPHSVIEADYKNVVTFFCSLGFNVLFVNYRGSLGLGETNVNSLPGHVGLMDVLDCEMARQRCLEKYPHLSPQKVFLFGGSHGGFLVLHLAGQYSSNYKGVVARNPVTNIASMCGVTDIPDWTLHEVGLAYNWLNSDPATLQRMWTMSPIAHVDKVTAPIFLMIGKNDLRVPPSQGYEYYNALKARGKTVKMHQYDDNHPLAKPEVDTDVMINTAIFFNELLEEAK